MWLCKFSPGTVDQFISEQRYKLICGEIGQVTPRKLELLQEAIIAGYTEPPLNQKAGGLI